MAKIDNTLFGRQHSEQQECPACASPLTIKSSKSGLFIGCTNYPKCDYTRPLNDFVVDTVKEIENSSCEKCGSILQIKRGRFGLFIGCSKYPACDFVSSLSQTDDSNRVQCPSCSSGELSEKTNRYGKRFFSCSDYPKCRYVLNSQPISKVCPQCNWPVLTRKAGKLYCPQKSCRYSADE